MTSMETIAQKAKQASMALAVTDDAIKSAALMAAAEKLRAQTNMILEANKQDMTAAAENNLSAAMMDRLLLDANRIEAIATAVEAIAALPDPVGEVMDAWDRPNGLHIKRVRTPLGVVAVIFESRPNVAADAGALCLKSGNAAILRSGSESLNSAMAIVHAMQQGLIEAGIDPDIIQIIPSNDRNLVTQMLHMSHLIDVVVPRGGRGLIEFVQKESKIPLFMHLEGLNNSYIHKDAHMEKALDVVINAKMRRTGICGATENILIDADIATEILPKLVERLHALSCEIRGDEAAIAIAPSILAASDADWDTEYLDAIVAVKIVADFHEAVDFIRQHHSQHTDAIITENAQVAEDFLNAIDSAIVAWNASTQFADGGEFGMGAEIGISTGKMHARGPVGVQQLTSFKYKIYGTGQIRPV